MANWNTIPGNTQATPGQTVRRKLDDSGFEGVFVPYDKSHVGLSNVDNTSDANKPVSTATQAAIDAIPTLTPQPEIDELDESATMLDILEKQKEIIAVLKSAGVTL